MTLNVALLGTGRIAEYGYIPAISKIDDVNIISVLSRSDIKGSQFAIKHSIPRAYVEIDDLLADNHLDAVIVCTPDSLHEEQVIKSCRAKKHILCEKPMSTSVESCENMIAEIEKSGIIFGMAHNNRFNAGLRYIKDVLDSSSIGQVYYARSILTTLQNDPSGWRALGKESKFWAMSATGAHMIDIFRWYFGEPTKMKKVSLSPKFKSINDEITTLSLNFNDSIICDITASAILPPVNRIEIYSTENTIIGENVFGIETNERIYHNNEKVMIEPISSFFGEVVDFTNAIIKSIQPRSTHKDGIENIRIMTNALSDRS